MLIVVIMSLLIAVTIMFVERSLISVTVLDSVVPVLVSNQVTIIVYLELTTWMVIPAAVKVRPFPIISAIPVFTSDTLVLYLIIMSLFLVIRPRSTC